MPTPSRGHRSRPAQCREQLHDDAVEDNRFRSGTAVPENAELIPFRVGKDDPAHIPLANVDVSSTQVEQPPDLVVLLPVAWADVEVDPVLDRLALGYARERQRRQNRARMVRALSDRG